MDQRIECVEHEAQLGRTEILQEIEVGPPCSSRGDHFAVDDRAFREALESCC
jgi:hypothetical protein